MEMEEVVEEWRRSGGVVVVGRQGSIPMLANTKVKCRFPGFVWRRGKGLVCMVCFFFLSFAFALPACAVAILICRGPGTTLDVGSPSQCTHNNGLSSPGRRAKLCSYSLVTSHSVPVSPNSRKRRSHPSIRRWWLHFHPARRDGGGGFFSFPPFARCDGWVVCLNWPAGGPSWEMPPSALLSLSFYFFIFFLFFFSSFVATLRQKSTFTFCTSAQLRLPLR